MSQVLKVLWPQRHHIHVQRITFDLNLILLLNVHHELTTYLSTSIDF